MKHQVRIAAGAAREIRRLPKTTAGHILKLIADLADDPRPSGAKKLQGIPGGYRIRAGIYRIVYSIKDDILSVDIVTVGHRNEVYKSIEERFKRRLH